MHSLLLRIFVSFWLIIGITVGAAAIAGYYYAEQARSALETFDAGDALLEASEALRAGGREGLASWLRQASRTRGVAIYIFDAEGRDLIGRPLPRHMSRALTRHRSRITGPSPADPGNLRRARPHSQLVSADGEIFTVLMAAKRRPPGIWDGAPTGTPLFLLALAVSGAVSYLLARAISRPVRQLRRATVALAEGRLDRRVSPALGRRRDELGMLARDFDTMADKLQRAAVQQQELSRTVSHELRSPLARLRVATELAKRKAGELPEFERMDEEAERLDRLIGQILSYTRLDSGPRLESGEVNLAELVQEVAENVAFECRSSGGNGIRVQARIEAAPRFAGYAESLTSAVENIARNAVRHSPPGGTVTIQLAGDRAGGATIDVLDEGPGVPEEELPRLFEPFFRTRGSAQDGDRPGTGLGLAIAERAVRQNGGTVTAANRPEGGLRVSISLPAASLIDRGAAGT